MDNQTTPLLISDSFRFSCSSNLECFNECCRDLNQFLTPYDILRLKNNIGLSSTKFLEKFTTQHIGPETGLPVISLKFDHSSDLICPFVTPDGCSVYEDRPSSCRTYPLARLVSRSRETGKVTEYFTIIKEGHCHGFNSENTQTVKDWIKNQGVEVYNKMNDLLLEIISLKNQLMPGMLDLKARHNFHMACYDLDVFRTNVFEKGLLKDYDIDLKTMDSVKKNDEKLLELGFKWVKQKLFEDY
jgi:Fe-S-cluster containining protein